MADFFKNLWGAQPPAREQNEFLGQILEVGRNKYRVKRLIAEGTNNFILTSQLYFLSDSDIFCSPYLIYFGIPRSL